MILLCSHVQWVKDHPREVKKRKEGVELKDLFSAWSPLETDLSLIYFKDNIVDNISLFLFKTSIVVTFSCAIVSIYSVWHYTQNSQIKNVSNLPFILFLSQTFMQSLFPPLLINPYATGRFSVVDLLVLTSLDPLLLILQTLFTLLQYWGGPLLWVFPAMASSQLFVYKYLVLCCN